MHTPHQSTPYDRRTAVSLQVQHVTDRIRAHGNYGRGRGTRRRRRHHAASTAQTTASSPASDECVPVGYVFSCIIGLPYLNDSGEAGPRHYCEGQNAGASDGRGV